MIDSFLALLGLGQVQSHRAEDWFAVASSHLANVEKICLEAGLRLIFEIDRLGIIVEKSGGSAEISLAPLINMQQQNEQIKALVETNRNLLNKMGANAKVVAELERWTGTCQVITTQIDIAVSQIEGAFDFTLSDHAP